MSSAFEMFLEAASATMEMLRIYYKGTSLEAPVAASGNTKFLHLIKEQTNPFIAGFLRRGHSMAETKAILKGQADLMEAGLCRTENQSKRWQEGDQSAWMEAALKGTEMECDGTEGVLKWFLTISSLLKLGVIENDEMNGWLMRRVIVKEKEVEIQEEDNDDGKACGRCETTTCDEDDQFCHRLLWNSNITGKEICRACVAYEDACEDCEGCGENHHTEDKC